MSTAVDLVRLRATLGGPEFSRLLDLLQRRIERGGSLSGLTTLTSASAAERTAIDAIFGRKSTRGASLQVDLDLLATTLRDAGICPDLRIAVEALRGSITDERAVTANREAEWRAVWAAAMARFERHAVLQPWLSTLLRLGIVRRLCGNQPAVAETLLAEVARVTDALPSAAEPLPALAARLFGNAHALDPGTARATLAVRAAARIGGIQFEDDAEGRRAAWASAGVMCDELSTPALVFNLPAGAATPLAQILRHGRNGGEPVHLSLRLLLHWPLAQDAALNGRDVFICENPTLVTLAADRLGQRSAPLICTNGQFATPLLVLLRQLRAAGARLWYHGDFDPAGLTIARRVMAESDARSWRFDADDYRAAPKGEKFAGLPGPTPWSEMLKEAMRHDGRAVHEETVFDLLAEDLARGEVSRK